MNLTTTEDAELSAMEEVIRPVIGQIRSLMTPGSDTLQGLEAFAIINAKKLWRVHGSFPDYCRTVWKWDLKDRTAYQWLNHAKVCLTVKSAQLSSLPKESQSRELAHLPEAFQKQVWEEVVASGRKITAEVVRKAVEEELAKMSGTEQLEVFQQSEAAIRGELKKSRTRDLIKLYGKVLKRAEGLWVELDCRDGKWFKKRIAELESET